MFFQKINSKNYVIDANAFEIINKIIDKTNKKRDRLIEKQQITGEDFAPLSVSYSPINQDNIEEVSKYMDSWLSSKMLAKNRKQFIIAKFNETPVNIKSWEVLGAIEPIDGSDAEYTLESYNAKDIPPKYRELEDPSNCEHCSTKRKRNKTFVIRNKDTEEVLQVGSSCMTDFIDKEDLAFLMTYTKVKEDIKAAVMDAPVKRSIELFNKMEVLAIMVSLREKNKVISTSTIFDIYNAESIERDFIEYRKTQKTEEGDLKKELLIQGQNIEVIKSYIPTEDHFDMAEDLLDFYEDLSVDKYSDKVFNIANIMNADTDFILRKEVDKITRALSVKQTIEKKDEDYKGLMADYNYGVEIGSSDKITYDYKDLYYAAKLSHESFDFVKPKDNEGLNTSTYIMMIINPDRVDELKAGMDENDFIEMSSKISELHENWKKAKKSLKVKEYFSELMEFAETVNNKENNFTHTIKSEIKNAETQMEFVKIENFTRKIIWADKLLKGFEEKKVKEQNQKEKDEKGLTGNIFEAKGDSFEKWEVKFKSIIHRSSIEYGTEWLEYVFEDKAGNNLCWSTNNGSLTQDEEEGSDLWLSNNVNKWIEIKGKFKENGKTYLNNNPERVIRVNYVTAISELNSEPSTNGEITMTEKGKKFKVESYRLDDIKSFEDSGSTYHQYLLEDGKGEMSSIVTQQVLDVHKEHFYKIGHMGEKIIRNVSPSYIMSADDYGTGAEYLTKTKMNKEFGLKVKKKAKLG